MKIKSIFLGLFLSLSGFQFAEAGGYSGGGGDYHQIGTGTSWFIGTKDIKYCIEVNPQFGFAATELQQKFEASAQTWKNYISERGIQTDLPSENRLNLNLNFVGACRGSENLKLYFGVDTKAVIEAKKNFEKPYAFAIRESYDLKSGMGTGFMWFAMPGSLFPLAGDTGFPNWSKPYTLQGMMLHELGHVLGVEHLDGTIMREDMMSSCQFMDSSEPWSQSRGKELLTNIDDTKILFVRSYSRIDIEGQFSYNNDALETKSLFKQFVGRDPIGPVKVIFSNGSPIRFIVEDSKEKNSFDIFSPLILQKEFSVIKNIFGVYFQDRYPTVLSTASIGISGIGTVKTKDGKVLTLQYGINSEGLAGPVRVTLVDGDQSKEIFYSKINGSTF